ncbi:MAG: 7,8-didemethyl-8-hydroxy-5-deazariboflavin synthase subunit CofG, partial [Solirubrobacterales bacterium]
MRRVTFSRNFTLSLSRSCQCYCKYCAFATHQAHVHAPAEVEEILDTAVRRNAKELLVLTGEKPEVNSVVAERLAAWGHEDFTSYVAWACERALERGMLPHTNLGVLSKADLARLREVTASQGLMLESVDERLMETVHAGSPTKHPAARLETIEAAGELKIPFTSGILVGVGESEESRVRSLEALAASHARHGHLQEIILQNFVPHPRYYGAEVADIADAASRARWRGEGDDPSVTKAVEVPPGSSPSPHEPPAIPGWANPVGIEEIKRLIAECKRLMPDVGVQVPPNLSDWWPELVEAGATDLGGLSANGDHISPEEPFPSPHQVRKELTPKGYALTERLCVYPQYMDSEWMEQGVLDVIKLKYWSFIPRRGSGRVSEESFEAGVAERAIAKGREGKELSDDELTALFSETRPEVIEEMRIAADELRAELAGETATFVINRNINFTNVCIVGC